MADEDKSPPKRRDGWEIAQILSSLMMPLALFALGYLGNQALEADQNRRAYVELLSRREESDSTLRKDMFGKVIDQFINKNNPLDLKTRILHLELLAYNFHESIDLKPLLNQVYEESLAGGDPGQTQRKRLQKLATDIGERELESLRNSGCVIETGDVSFEDLRKDHVLNRVLEWECPESKSKGLTRKWFRVDVLTNPVATNLKRQSEVDVRLRAGASATAKAEKDFVFTVTPFDFPMIDNVRLEDRTRVSVVMTRVDDGGVALKLVYFPAARTSLKDKPFHDEVLTTLSEYSSAKK